MRRRLMEGSRNAGTTVSGWIRNQADQYRGGADRPLGGYVAVLGAYTGLVGVISAVGRAGGRQLPERVGPLDLTLMAVATYRLSRTLARDAVTSPIRAPFTRYDGPSLPGEVSEEVRGEGIRHAVGELIACPMCLAQWVATGLAGGIVLAPRATRLAMATMSGVAGADFLQNLYALLEHQTEH